jgi:hypothetical protein
VPDSPSGTARWVPFNRLEKLFAGQNKKYSVIRFRGCVCHENRFASSAHAASSGSLTREMYSIVFGRLRERPAVAVSSPLPVARGSPNLEAQYRRV